MGGLGGWASSLQRLRSRMRLKEGACHSCDGFVGRDSCRDWGGKWQGKEMPQLLCLEYVLQMFFPVSSYQCDKGTAVWPQRKVTSCPLIPLSAVQGFRKEPSLDENWLFLCWFFFFFLTLNSVAEDFKKGTKFPKRKNDLKSFSTTCPGKAQRGHDFTWESLSNKSGLS